MHQVSSDPRRDVLIFRDICHLDLASLSLSKDILRLDHHLVSLPPDLQVKLNSDKALHPVIRCMLLTLMPRPIPINYNMATHTSTLRPVHRIFIHPPSLRRI